MKCMLADTEVEYTPFTQKDHQITVYFPFNCLNNCKFCTSKEFYNTYKSNKEKVLNVLKKIGKSEITQVSITGGEPSSNIPLLAEMLELIKTKKVYINTTFLRETRDDFCNLINSYENIKGINISRHKTSFKEDCKLLYNICSDKDILKINTNVRINIFCGEEILKGDMLLHLARWEKIFKKKSNLDLSFRHDYNKITEKNLHDLNTNSIKNATELAEYYGHVYCHVCDKLLFKTKSGMNFRIHRGLNCTRIKIGNIIEMQEMVLFPDGELCTDWDYTKDGLEEFCKILKINL